MELSKRRGTACSRPTNLCPSDGDVAHFSEGLVIDEVCRCGALNTHLTEPGASEPVVLEGPVVRQEIVEIFHGVHALRRRLREILPRA